MAYNNFVVKNGLTVGPISLDASTGNANISNIAISGRSNLGSVSNITIFGGSSGYVLSTDGSGNLSWASTTSGQAGGAYIYTQSSATSSWVINHNLGYQYVNIEVIDSTGKSWTGRYNYPTITFNNTTHCTVTFDSAQAGYAAITLGAGVAPGANTQIIFNDAGATGASSNLTFDKSSNTFSTHAANVSVLNVSANANLGAVGNLVITGGSNGQVLTTNGSGGLTWASSSGNESHISNGTSNVTVGTAGGNVTVSVAGTPNVVVVSSSNLNVAGNINASYFYGAGNGLSNVQGANVTGAVSSATTAGTVTTNAQPNITSVGTMSSLNVNGTITGVNITANTGVFTGNGSGLSAIAGANITGTVANATYSSSAGTATSAASATTAGTVTTNAQPNITSVGTLASVTSTGNVTAGNLVTTGILSVTGTGQSSIAGNLTMNSKNIVSLADPVNVQDAATKGYVDNVAQGLDVKASCQLATAAALPTYTYNNGTSGVGSTITGSSSGLLTIDGIAVAVGDRVLVKNETSTNAPYNGIYVVTTAGNAGTSYVLTRAVDFDSGSPSGEIPGAFTFIEQGSTNADTGWVCTTNNPVTVGTTDITFTKFSSAGTYEAGSGLTLTGSTFSVNVAQPTITSVGTLTTLGVNGTITGVNITANTGVFTGNGSGLSAIAGANITGTVANATYSSSAGTATSATSAGTVTTNAQPNITSVGTLTSLGVNGTVTGVNFTANTGVFTGNGSGLSAITGANVTGTVANATYSSSAGSAATATSATTAGTVTTNAQPNITSVGTLTTLAVSGISNVGAVSNLIITGGSNGQVLTTNGAGALSWTTVSGGGGTSSNISNGTSNVNIAASAGNVTVSVAGNANILTITGTGANISGTANVTGNIIGGNLQGPLANGNSNVNIPSANGNVTISAIGTSNVVVVANTGVTVTGNLNVTGTTPPRSVQSSDATSITINIGTTDVAYQINTQAAGTLTINAPTGTAVNGQKLVLRIKSTNIQTLSFNAVFAGSTDLALPTATSGSSKTDYLGFIYDSTASKWHLLGKTFGFV